MKRIIVESAYFKDALEHFQCVLRCGSNDSDVHFFTLDGQAIVEYHLKEGQVGDVGSTTDPVNTLWDLAEL